MVDNIEELIKHMNDPETLLAFRKVVEESGKEFEDKKKKVTSYEYMSWLKKFITSNGFASDSKSFPPKLMNKHDEDNVNLLSVLYYVVDDYATSHGSMSSDSYSILFDDSFIELKLFSGQGCMCFARGVEAPAGYISFDDVANNKKEDRTSYLISEIDKYQEHLKESYNKDDTVQDAFELKQDKAKRYVKK